MREERFKLLVGALFRAFGEGFCRHVFLVLWYFVLSFKKGEVF